MIVLGTWVKGKHVKNAKEACKLAAEFCPKSYGPGYVTTRTIVQELKVSYGHRIHLTKYRCYFRRSDPLRYIGEHTIKLA